MEPIIRASHLYIRYLMGDFRDIGLKEWIIQRAKRERRIESRWAVEDVSFTLERGDFMGIIGANGAGKSTLLKSVCGILPPKQGELQVDGNVIALLELGTGFDGDLNLIENIYMRGALLGYTKEFIAKRVAEIIRFAELEPFQYYKYKQLSSGMRSRLAFSIACMVDPEILILDEVLSVGDGGFRKKSEAKMREIIKGGATTLFVSHSTTQMRRLCNKLIWLDNGKQIAFAKDKKECATLLTRYERYLKQRSVDPNAKPDLTTPLPASKPKAKTKPEAKSAPNPAPKKEKPSVREICLESYVNLLHQFVADPTALEHFNAYFQQQQITHIAVYGESMLMKTLAVLLNNIGVTIDYMIEDRAKSNYCDKIQRRDCKEYPDTQRILIADVRCEDIIQKKLAKLTSIPAVTVSELIHYTAK